MGAIAPAATDCTTSSQDCRRRRPVVFAAASPAPRGCRVWKRRWRGICAAADFREATLQAVNLGDDADTMKVVCATTRSTGETDPRTGGPNSPGVEMIEGVDGLELDSAETLRMGMALGSRVLTPTSDSTRRDQLSTVPVPFRAAAFAKGGLALANTSTWICLDFAGLAPGR